MRCLSWMLAAALASLASTHPASAQRVSAVVAGFARTELTASVGDSDAVSSNSGLTRGTDSTTRAPRAIDRLPLWSAPLASLALPGIGQARLREGRAMAYLAAEGFLLLQYSKDLREGHRNERDYREIARTIARRNFAAAPPDTIWQYYEKLTEYVESGAFTTATSGPTVPEPDPTTYNGFQWKIARNQFGVPDDPSERGSARYQRALELYESRAVRQAYRWSWRNAQLEKDLYTRTISRTNAAYRRATLDLSAMIANHLLSAIDAFAMIRLSPGSEGNVRVSTTITLP